MTDVLTGVARQFDQACIVHAIWLRLAATHTAMWVTRVPTKDNIADDPSRQHSIALQLTARVHFACQGVLRIAEKVGRYLCASCVTYRVLEPDGLGVAVRAGHRTLA